MLYSLLLAGGKSSRMGVDKRFLEYRGQSLLAHARQLLEQAGADAVLVSGDVDGVDCIPDRIPECGPLGGLHAALHYIHDAGRLDEALLLVIPVDMPLLSAPVLTALVEGIGTADNCHYAGEIFPCVLRAGTALMGHLDGLLEESTALGGKRSMKALLGLGREKILETRELPESTFLNLNKPEDWQQFVDGSKNLVGNRG